MHTGMVETQTEKMAKSVGNIFQLSEALDRFGPETVVAYMVGGHYHQPIAFSEGALAEAGARVERIRNFLRDGDPGGEPDRDLARLREEFLAALADDFNTPRAMAAIFELIAEGHRRELPGARATLTELLPLVGLGSLAGSDSAADPEAERLLAEREEARAARDFERADELRDELAERGYEVRDGSEGARLVRRA